MILRYVAIVLGIACVVACWPLAAALCGVGVLVAGCAGRGARP